MIVMMVCHFDETNSLGGLERQAQLLAETLVARGEKVVILGSTRDRSKTGWRTRNAVPTRLFWTYASPQLSGRYFPAAIIWAAQLLTWLFRHRRQISVLHCHQLRIHSFVASLARRWMGLPSIGKSATGGSGADILAIGTRKYFGRVGRNFVIRNTDVFVATTRSIAEDLTRAGVPQQKVCLIPNGLVMPPPEREHSSSRFRRCVFVGRLEDDKNVVPLALAASQTIVDTEVSLDFYGAGSRRNELDAIARQNPSQIKIKGHVDRIEPLLHQYGWLLLPSKAEGLSNAMLEAMSHGVVPVVTEVSGSVDHIVDEQNGRFLSGSGVDDISSGLTAIAETTDAHWAQLSRTAEAYARSHFGIEQVAAQYQTLYAQLRRPA